MKLSPIDLPSGYRPLSRGQRFFARSTGARFDARAAGQITQIDFFNEVGPHGISANAFREKLSAAAGDILLRINSPGGDVFDGIAIYNMLVQHRGTVTVEIVGLAASAASVIAMAADRIRIASNSFLMLHGAWTLTIGNAADHEETQRLLNQIDKSLASTYSDRSGQTVEVVTAAMAAETWLQGQEAVDVGLADELLAATDASARFDLSVFKHAPADLQQGAIPPTTIESPVALERLLRSAGLSNRQAKKVAIGGWAELSTNDTDISGEILALQQRVAAATAQIKGS